MTVAVPVNVSAADRARIERVEQLARAGRDGISALVALLADPNWVVRRAVVGALAARGDDVLDELTALLVRRGDNEARLAAAVDTLVASRGDADQRMMELARTGAPIAICDAAQVLGRRRARQAVPLLAELTHHRDDNVAVAALEALGRIGGIDTVEPLMIAAGSRNFFRTFPAIDALGRTGDVRAVRPLVSLSKDPLYAAEAIRALGRTGQPAAVGTLAELLVSPSDATVRAAAASLAELCEKHDARFGPSDLVVDSLRAAVDGPTASSRLLEALVGVSGSELAGIVQVLGFLGDPLAVARLVELAVQDDPLGALARDALRRLGSRAAAEIVEALRTGTSAARARLLPLVQDAGDQLPVVSACLEDDDPDVRCRACDALARIGVPAAVAGLFVRLADPDPRVVQAATAAIHALGSLDTKRLALEGARSADGAVRRAALRIVSYFAYPEGLALLVAAARDEDEKIREAALQGLPLYEDAQACDSLLVASVHPSARTRASALRSLGLTRPLPKVVHALQRALGDDDPWARYYACQALGSLRVEEAVSLLIARLADDSVQVRAAAVEALSLLKSDAAFAQLAKMAESTEQDLQRAAVTGLGNHRRREAIPLLRAAATNEAAAIRLAALGALSGYGEPEVVPILEFASADPDGAVRAAAIGYLATRTGAAATRALLDRLAQPETRERALEAMAVGGDERVEHLLAALENADAENAARCVEALSRIRRPSAYAALASALTVDNVHARRAAATALAAVGTTEARNALRRAGAADPDEQVRRVCATADGSSG